MSKIVAPVRYFYFIVLLAVLQFSSCVYEPADQGDASLRSQDNLILSFEVVQGTYAAFMEVNTITVSGTVEEGIDLSDISLNITVSDNASISPDPSTITSITGPFQFTVTSQEGLSRIYTVDISNAAPAGPSDDNFITSFNIVTPTMTIPADIDDVSGRITQGIPATMDLSNLSVAGTISDDASISVAISSISDFSMPVTYTVTSESGIDRVYEVEITHLNTLFTETCDTGSVSKWFGGYDFVSSSTAIPFDRNVGTGQTLLLEADTMPLSFSIYLDGGFRYYDADVPYDQPLDIKLNIRNEDGVVLGSTIATVDPSYNGGAIEFDLSNLDLLLQAGTPYRFQWFVVNGAAAGVMTRSKADNSRGRSGFCFQGGFSGQSFISEGTQLEQDEIWVVHPWNFNIAFSGIQ
jgi:hypothetical protein